MKKVFITGINGFIGKYLTTELLTEGFEIHGLVQEDIDHPIQKNVILHQGDLTDFDKIGEILQEVDPNFIIHLAARTEVEKSFHDTPPFR